MFYIKEKKTGKDIAYPGKDILRITDDGGTGSIITLVKSNRVLRSDDSVTTIVSRNKGDVLILVTRGSVQYAYPAEQIKTIEASDSGSEITFRSSSTRKTEVNESPSAIIAGIPGGGSAAPEFTQEIQTTDGNQTPLPGSLDIDVDSVYSFETIIIAIHGPTGDVAVRKYKVAIKKIGGTTTLVDSFTTEDIAVDAGAVSWSAVVEANDTTDQLDYKVTGEAGHDIEWKAITTFYKVTF